METTEATLASPQMISSDKVAGTEVFSPAGESIGKIEQLIIEKTTGRVVYAVMTFGGFLGMGKNRYPVPWGMLKYDTALEGYRTSLTREQLDAAPQYLETDTRPWANSEWNSRVHRHFDLPPYL